MTTSQALKPSTTMHQPKEFDRRCKLTQAQRQDIRENAWGLSRQDLARAFGVSQRLITLIQDPEKNARALENRRKRAASTPKRSTMTLKQLQKRHPDLRNNYGDPLFRRSVWAPFFENLHENKVIYREKFICLARLDDLEIDERGVRGTVVPLHFLRTYPHRITPSLPWHFGGTWENMCQGDRALGQPYASWTIWPEPELIRAIEKLLAKEDIEGAMKLLNPDGE